MSTFNLFPPAVLSDLEMEEDYLSEDVFLDALTEKVIVMLDKNLDFFLSLLYRLDVKEVDIKRALLGQDKIIPAKALAILIVERQKKRIASRRKFKSEPIDWEE